MPSATVRMYVAMPVTEHVALARVARPWGSVAALVRWLARYAPDLTEVNGQRYCPGCDDGTPGAGLLPTSEFGNDYARKSKKRRLCRECENACKRDKRRAARGLPLDPLPMSKAEAGRRRVELFVAQHGREALTARLDAIRPLADAHRPRGDAHPRARLTADFVRQARARWKNKQDGKDTVTLKQLAEEAGTTTAAMWSAVSGRTWKHVT